MSRLRVISHHHHHHPWCTRTRCFATHGLGHNTHRNFDEAKTLLHQALSIDRPGGDTDTDTRESQLMKSVELFSQHEGPVPLYLRQAHNALGVLHLSRHDLDQAQTHLNTALHYVEQDAVNGYGHDRYMDIGGILNDLALVNFQQGQIQEAERMLRRALYMAKRAHVPDPALVTATHVNLSNIYDHDGKMDQAREQLQLAMTGLLQQKSSMPDTKAKEHSNSNSAECRREMQYLVQATAVHSNIGRIGLLSPSRSASKESRLALEFSVTQSQILTKRHPNAGQHPDVHHRIHSKCLANLALFHLMGYHSSSAWRILNASQREFGKTKREGDPLDRVKCLVNFAAVSELKRASKLYTQCQKILRDTSSESTSHVELQQCQQALDTNQDLLKTVMRESKHASIPFPPVHLLEALQMGYGRSCKSRIQLLSHRHTIMGVAMFD